MDSGLTHLISVQRSDGVKRSP